MKTVIELAQAAGYPLMTFDGKPYVSPELERFAELVRADERNRTWTQEHWTEYERSIVEAEREACAKVVESHGPTLANGAMLAEAIKARSNT